MKMTSEPKGMHVYGALKAMKITCNMMLDKLVNKANTSNYISIYLLRNDTIRL